MFGMGTGVTLAPWAPRVLHPEAQLTVYSLQLTVSEFPNCVLCTVDCLLRLIEAFLDVHEYTICDI